MTLIVGVLAKDGVVIASDQQATHGAAGAPPTVAVPVTKSQIINGRYIFSTSGPVGLGQELSAVVESNTKGTVGRVAFPKKFRKGQKEIIDPLWETAKKAAGVMPQAHMSAACSALLAGPFSDEFQLAEITPTGGYEWMSSQLPFVAIGSGKANADPLIGFLWKVLWNKEQPVLQDATLAAYWVVKLCIEMQTSGVGYEVDVFQLSGTGNQINAKKLAQSELLEHNELIAAVEERIFSFREAFQANSGEEDLPPDFNSN